MHGSGYYRLAGIKRPRYPRSVSMRLEIQQRGGRDLEGASELSQRVDLSRGRVLGAFQALHVAVGQVRLLR